MASSPTLRFNDGTAIKTAAGFPAAVNFRFSGD